MRRGDGPLWVWSLAASIAFVAVAGVAAVATVDHDDALTAEQLLERAASFTAGAGSVSFKGHTELAVAPGTAGGRRDDDRVRRYDSAGHADLPDRWRRIDDHGDDVRETVVVADEVYARTAGRVSGLPDERFAELSSTFDPDVVWLHGAGSIAAGSPIDLPRLLHDVRPSGPAEAFGRLHLVEVDVEPADVLPAAAVADFDVDVATLHLWLSDDGRPHAVRFELRGDGIAADIRFDRLRWGGAVTVERPAEGQLDETPLLSEEDVADYDLAPVVQLGRIPEGWLVSGAYVLPAEDTVEGCEQVALDYVDPDEPDAGYLWVYVLPTSCAGPEVPSGATALQTPAGAGWAEEDGGAVFVQVESGDTTIQLDTDLPLFEVLTLLEWLEPFDARTVGEPEEVPGLGRRATTG